MARLLLILLACVIPLGLGWAGEAPAPQADDEYADLDSGPVPPDLVRTDAEGGGEIFHAYTDEEGVHSWVNKTYGYLDETYKSDKYSGSSVYLCPMATAEIPNQWHWHIRFSFHYSMNNA